MFSEKTSKNRIGSTLAIAAGKGGVGKSTVTVNLALALKHMGLTVGILDADLYGPSLKKMLPEEQPPDKKGDSILPALSKGIYTLSMAHFREEGKASALRAPLANGVVTQFLTQTLWPPLDYLLIDFPPGTGDIQLTLSQKANITAAIMVTTPQELAALDVRKAVHLFEQVNIPILGVVENMSGYFCEATKKKIPLFGQGGGRRLAKETNSPLLAEIPIESKVCACSDEGKSLIREFPSSLSSQAFMLLAERVHGHTGLLTKKAQNFELQWNHDSSY